MKKKLFFFAEQLLIVANIFVVFILIFESKLSIPVWLQPVGRMHTLMLHFPIVLLLLAMFLDFFSFKKQELSEKNHPNFSQKLLLVGSLLTAITVIMGLFLSREDGYSGSSLQWHKWTGAGTLFLVSIVYFVRNTNWYKPVTAKAAGIVILFVLIAAGHYGASLTHGENFILQPVTGDKGRHIVPVEQAIVFEDVIKPILEKKCAGCHNPDKMKGELILTDSISIMKGGKSGKLFIPGDADLSLILERIHLPWEEKKHMPPEGKPQLTSQETLLIRLWIQNNADFNKKVTAFPADDSLRLAASIYLQPPLTEEKFEFAAADEKTIESLNTNYRTIRPIAEESPALAVNIYNAAVYNSKQLKELDAVKDKIVSLNLDKLPVKDEDLKIVSQFENLRKLELNFTDVTSKGVKELVRLQNLRSLTLSGVKINFQDLKEQLSAMRTLKMISVWNTGLTEAEAAQLQKDNTGVVIISGFKEGGKDTLTLNPPQVKNQAMVFDHDIALQLAHPVKGVEIRYSLDGNPPDSINSPVFEKATKLDKTTTVKAKAYKKGWHSSDIIAFDFLKTSIKPDSTALLFPLNSVHLADGANTFFDNKLGVIGANNPAWANYWAGVRNNDMGVVSLFKTPVTISSVGLHYMVEEETGIYPPMEVEVWGGENEKKAKLLVKMKPELPKKGEKPSLKLIESYFRSAEVSYLKVIAKPYQKKNDRYLLLVDEMLFN